MMRWLLVWLLAAAGHSVASAAPEHAVRPISAADTALAIYCDDVDRTSPTEPGIIAVWTDGQIVWSADRLHGGEPYREGRIDPERLTYRYAGRDFRLTDVAGNVLKPILA